MTTLLHRFLVRTGAKAAGADFHALPFAGFRVGYLRLVQVGVPDLFRFVVCVAYIVTDHRAFAAYLADS